MAEIDPKNKLTANPVLIITATAKAASGGRDRFTFVTITGALPSAGAAVAGVTNATASEGESIPITAIGTETVIAGAAVAAMAEVETDASGRAITLDTGIKVGVALSAASQAGDLITVLMR